MEEDVWTISRELLDFVEESPTCFHVVENAGKMLEAEGYLRLSESGDWREEEYFRKWRLGAGKEEGKFYVTRNDSSLLAFHIPAGRSQDAGWKGFHIAASHVDSPCFKIKERPELLVENQYVKLNAEKYGGMLLSSWMDRPLSVAGRLVVQGERGLESRLVNLKEDLLVIPNLAVHLNREMNKGVEYNAQTDMLPLYGGASAKEGSLAARAAEAAGVELEKVWGQDLFLYVNEPGRFLGTAGEFLLSPRLDDQQCVFASLKGFLGSVPEEYLNVCALLDNEEVGSRTRQGADSDFLEGALRRLCEALGLSWGEYHRLVAGGFLISADNAHAVHPNHPEKSDPTNRPYLNGGIVLKFQGSQKYSTDGFSAAYIRRLCGKAGVPCQTYANRSDIAGGSTLGNISISHVSVSTADIGLPQLAMHSAAETAGARDTEYAVRLFQTFWSE